jgi:hypothetical protein
MRLLQILITINFFIFNVAYTQQLELEGNGTSGRILVLKNEGNANSHTYFTSVTASDQINTTPTYEGWRSRGTLDNLQDVTTGDRILALMGLPYINGSYRPTSAIEFWAGNTPNANSHPTYITISTTANDQTTRQERLRIAENGSVGIGSNNPKSKLHISGGSVYLEDINTGIIMKSPNGQCWQYKPDNSGVLVGVTISCP